MSNPFTRKDALTDVVAQVMLGEKTLTDAEKKKREEIAQAMERENPGMDMGKKMAIATAQAKKVAEEVDLDESDYKNHFKVQGKYKDKDGNTASVTHRIKYAKDAEHAKRLASDGVGKSYQGYKPLRATQTEEVENLDELSQMKLANYVAKAATSLHNNAKEAGQYDDKENANKAFKRYLGIKSAAVRLRGRGELPGKESAIGAYPKMKYKTEEVDQDEDLEMFLEEYTTMFNEAEDTQQLMLLRAMAQDPSELMKMKRALKAGDKAMTNPVLRGEILKMLDQMMNLTTTDKSLLQRTRAGFQKAKSMPEEVELDEQRVIDMKGKTCTKCSKGKYGKDHPDDDDHYDDLSCKSCGHKTERYTTLLNLAQKKKKTNEEVESLDELSKETLGNYIKKANSGTRGSTRSAYEAGKTVSKTGENSKYNKIVTARANKRMHGINTATDKLLAKEDVEQIDEAKKTTHEDQLITVHKDGRLHAHAHLSTINDIHGTDVKHTAIHAGGAKVKTKYGDNLEYKLSKHHAKGVQESVEVDEAVRIRDRSRGFEKEVKYAGRTFGIDRHGDDKTTFQGQMDRKHLAAAAKARRARTGPGVKGFNSAMRSAKKGEYQPQETGSVRARNEEVAKDAPFEGGREVKSTKSAAERVKKIAKGMEKHYNKDKK